jgi:FOG: GAF domain
MPRSSGAGREWTAGHASAMWRVRGDDERPESPASRLDVRQVSRARPAVMRGSRGSPEEQRASFLAEAGALIGSSLDYDRVLPRLARLALPVMGDLCAIDLLQVDGSIVRVASAHVDSTKEALVYEVRSRHGFNRSSPNGVGAAIQSRRSILLSTVTGADLEGEALNPDQLSIFRQLDPKSWMIAPLVGREQPLGAISFAVTESRRRYRRADLLCAEVVARQAAIAMEGARPIGRRRRPAPKRKRRTVPRTSSSPSCPTSFAIRSTPCRDGPSCSRAGS